MLTKLLSKIRRSPLGELKLLTNIYAELVMRRHGSNEVRVGEDIVRFDPRDRLIARKLVVDGGFEQAEIKRLCSFVRPGDTVLDIGANIGLYTLALSRATKESGKVIAFEPDPDNLVLLRHNVAANGCKNVIIVPCGLDEFDGTRKLYQIQENRGQLSFADLSGKGEFVEVPVRRGESVLKEFGVTEPTTVKIDVEGAENLVLEGLGFRPRYLQFEFIPEHLRALDVDPATFLAERIMEGYSLHVIDRDSGELEPVSAEVLLDRAERTVLDHNVMAIRSTN